VWLADILMDVRASLSADIAVPSACIVLSGRCRITESNVQDMLREVRMALLEADVALPVVKDFMASVKERAVGHEVIGSLTPGQAFIGVVNQVLTELMGTQNSSLNLAAVPPADNQAFATFLQELGYVHTEQTGNAAYRLFLGQA